MTLSVSTAARCGEGSARRGSPGIAAPLAADEPRLADTATGKQVFMAKTPA